MSHPENLVFPGMHLALGDEMFPISRDPTKDSIQIDINIKNKHIVIMYIYIYILHIYIHCTYIFIYLPRSSRTQTLVERPNHPILQKHTFLEATQIVVVKFFFQIPA